LRFDGGLASRGGEGGGGCGFEKLASGRSHECV
jgi:hypothetical protein